MYNPDTDLIFPTRIIPELINLRGEKWNKLVGNIIMKDQKNIELLAFVLFMTRLNGCITCNSDSFRAMRGCTLCATQNVKRFKGSDEELIDIYNKSIKEVEKYLFIRNS